MNISNIDNSTAAHGQYRGTAAGTPAPDLDDLDFEKVETRRLIRDGHVTINHYYMNKGPEIQPEPEPKPQPQSRLCVLCNDWYFEEDNVLQEDGRPPCGSHSGMIRPSGTVMATC